MRPKNVDASLDVENDVCCIIVDLGRLWAKESVGDLIVGPDTRVVPESKSTNIEIFFAVYVILWKSIAIKS